jgi:hypothetical protein
VRKVTYDSYQCEVCGTHYETPEQAVACENAGRPQARYPEGTAVRFRPGAGPDVLQPETFTVESNMVTLSRPARADCGGGARHAVSYVLQNDLGRVSFISENQLMPLS